MASCGTIIEGNVVSFPCSLEQGHDGPHLAYENARSVRERKAWEKDRAAAAHTDSGLAQFQGRAETTAERYTDNPTPVPRPASALFNQENGPRVVVPEAVQVTYEEHIDGSSIFRIGDLGPDVPWEVAVDQVWDMNIGPLATDGIFTPGVTPPSVLPMVVTAVLHEGQTIRVAFKDYPMTGAGPEYDVPIDEFYRIAHQRLRSTEERDALLSQVRSEPTKQREGDQVLPTPTGGAYVQDRILEKARVLHDQGTVTDDQFSFLTTAMEESKRVGSERYGTPLQTFNGRDSLEDLEDELRDAFVYVSQLRQARDADRATLVNVVAREIRAADGNHTLGAGALAEVAVDAILRGTGGIGT